MRIGRESRWRRPLAVLMLVGGVGAIPLDACRAQCDVLLRETFRFGPRPHGGNGQSRVVELEDRFNDYWPQVSSIGARWLSGDQAPQPLWQFAWSNIDPAEFDPLEGPDGSGIAYGEGGAAVMIQFGAPATPFTMTADLILGGPIYLGYTTSTAFVHNFQTDGALWMRVDQDITWTIYANGSEVVASGTSLGGGVLNGGYYRMEMTFDPFASQVSCNVAGELYGPFNVTLTRPLAYFGMEAEDDVPFSAAALNNLSIYTGAPVTIGVSGPTSTCIGDTATLVAATNAAAPAGYLWTRDGNLPLENGAQPSGAVISGATTPTLVITGVKADDLGAYGCVVTSDCGLHFSDVFDLRRCVADFNCDASISSQDFFDFLTAFFAASSTADLNNDGSTNSQDFFDFVAAFFSGC